MLIEKERIRKQVHAVRMIAAQAHYEECLAILAIYGGPGGGGRYGSRVEAQAARRRYARAYQIVWHRTPKGKARMRARDNRERSNVRKSRTDGTTEFYFRMLTAEQVQCFYCHRELAVHERVGDHCIPLARKGKHSVGNLRVACVGCNSMKGARMPEEFMREIANG